jgi:hypothetical protein
MKKITLILSVLIFAAAFADARGRGFSGGGRRGGSTARGSSPGSRGFSGGSGGFSRSLSRPTLGRTTSFHAARSSLASSTFRARSFAVASRRSSVAGGGTSAPAWATPGAMIRSAGQQPVYSNPGGGSTLSVDGGGFIAMDQGHANDVGRGPGVTWGAPDRASSSGSSGGGGGGSGASSNGPESNPGF